MADLVDIRSKVARDVYHMLRADMRALGKSESDLVRAAVESFYRPRIHAATIFDALERSEGHSARLYGLAHPDRAGLFETRVMPGAERVA